MSVAELEERIARLEKALDYAIWRISMNPHNQIQIRAEVQEILHASKDEQ